MLDLTNKVDRSEAIIEKKIVTMTLHLTRLEMIEALKHEKIFIDSSWYKVPKMEILDLLRIEIYGCIEFHLEEIK